jgi:M6 family metalloprotease-like protein
MSNKLRVAVFVVLCLWISNSASNEVEAASPKANKKCSKLGIKQVVSGKLYFCIKKNGKLVWSVGVENKKDRVWKDVPTSPKDLSNSEVITSNAEMNDLNICKTSDLTSRPDVSNGFPRPASATIGKANIKILFVPISFTDFPFSDEDLKRNLEVTEDVRNFYTKTSYGNVSISFEFLEKKYWVNMGKSAASYNLIENKPQQNNKQVVVDALNLVDSAINFDLYNAVVVESGRFQSTGGGQGFPGDTFSTKTGSAKGVSFEFGTGVASFHTLAHELGHTLFGLEDLYVFLNSNRPTAPDPTPAGSWDMMSNSTREFFGWTKLMNGWIQDSQVRCLTTQSSTMHYLEDISIASSKQYLWKFAKTIMVQRDY